MGRLAVPHLYYSNGVAVLAGDEISFLGKNDTMKVSFNAYWGGWNALWWLKKDQDFIKQDGKLYLHADVILMNRVNDDKVYDMNLKLQEDMNGDALYPGVVVEYRNHRMRLIYRPDKLAYMWHIIGTGRFIYHSSLNNKFNKMKVSTVFKK